MAAGGHFGWPKITFDHISRHFRSICNFYFFSAILDDRKSLSIAFLAISDQYTTLFFLICSQNGCRRPFWMTENHLRCISRHFRSIRNFILFLFGSPKWLPAAILDDRKSLSITFLAISDQYATFFLICSQNGCRRPFWMTENHFRSHFSPFQINMQLLLFLICSQNGCRRPFWMTENHFRCISRHYRSIHNFYVLDFFHKMPASGHFGWPKITFDRISHHFRSICNFFFTKWLPAAILDDRKALLIAFLAISDQYATFILFHKMAASGYFGWQRISFGRISRHFRSIRNFDFFHKMAAGGILDDRKSLSITFLASSEFWSHFSPFQINTQLFF